MTCAPRRPSRARALAIAAIVVAPLLAAGACKVPAGDARGTGAVGGDCADMETLRVCWDGGGVRVVKRPLPASRRPASAPPFACAGKRCEQRHPRMPDDGEWDCEDSAGATVCMGGERAAGVAPAPAEAGWFCGARRGGQPPARVCVDLSPDFPDGHAPGWRCRTLYDGPTRRACERDPDAHTLAEACDAGHPCVDGSRCADGWCVPARPAPACWLQTDCPTGARCRFGSCLAGDV